MLSGCVKTYTNQFHLFPVSPIPAQALLGTPQTVYKPWLDPLWVVGLVFEGFCWVKLYFKWLDLCSAPSRGTKMLGRWSGFWCGGVLILTWVSSFVTAKILNSQLSMGEPKLGFSSVHKLSLGLSLRLLFVFLGFLAPGMCMLLFLAP